jgi:uncharacterized protein
MMERCCLAAVLLNQYFNNFDKCVVAYSGGADSTAVLMMAAEAMGPDNVLAVTLEPEHVFWYQVEQARAVAGELGVKWISKKVYPPEEFYENRPDKCYTCKCAMLAAITETAIEKGIDTVFDGTNTDDLNEHRPGSKALIEYGVRSPLLENGLGKSFVHEKIAPLEKLGYRFHDESCIVTRIEGLITPEKMKAVEAGENALRDSYSGLRLRLFDREPCVRFKKPVRLGGWDILKLSKELNSLIK